LAGELTLSVVLPARVW